MDGIDATKYRSCHLPAEATVRSHKLLEIRDGLHESHMDKSAVALSPEAHKNSSSVCLHLFMAVVFRILPALDDSYSSTPTRIGSMNRVRDYPPADKPSSHCPDETADLGALVIGHVSALPNGESSG